MTESGEVKMSSAVRDSISDKPGEFKKHFNRRKLICLLMIFLSPLLYGCVLFLAHTYLGGVILLDGALCAGGIVQAWYYLSEYRIEPAWWLYIWEEVE